MKKNKIILLLTILFIGAFAVGAKEIYNTTGTLNYDEAFVHIEKMSSNFCSSINADKTTNSPIITTKIQEKGLLGWKSGKTYTDEITSLNNNYNICRSNVSSEEHKFTWKNTKKNSSVHARFSLIDR